MSQPKLAIIGLGNWGKKLLSEFVNYAEVLYACSSGEPENKLWLDKNYLSIQYTEDIKVILNDSSVAAVVIATPISTHFQLAMDALRADKQVFLEKPASTEANQVDLLARTAVEHKKTLFVDHIFRYDPSFTELKNTVKNQKISSLNFRWLKSGTFKEDIYWNLLYHELYLAAELTGSIKINEIIQSSSDENTVVLSFKTQSDVLMSFFIDRNSDNKEKILTIKTKNEELFWKSAAESNEPMKAMIEDFLTSIKNGSFGLTNQLAYQTVKLIETLKKEIRQTHSR